MRSSGNTVAQGRHCHSTLSLTVIDCHFLGILRMMLLHTFLHSNIAVIAVIFSQSDSVALS